MKKLSIKNISIFILIALIILGHIYMISFEPYDELWNFQNIYKLYNGHKMYTDANIIVTPIFYILGLIFFRIFNSTIICFRFFNVCIVITFFILLYNIFKHLKVSNHIISVFLALILLQFLPIINGGANYNILCLTFILLGILSYLKLFNKKYFNYLQGFIIFLVFFTKQNLGIYYAIGILIFEFIYKNNFKEYTLNQIKKLTTFIIPLILSILIFYFTNTLSDFINYTFGGLLNFGSSNIVFDASPYLLTAFIIILFFYFYILTNKKIFNEKILNTDKRKNLHLIGIITISISLSLLPIINTAHLQYIFPFYLMILFYFLDFTILEELFSKEKHIKFTYIITILILLFIVIKIFYSYLSEKDSYTRISDQTSPFDYTLISNENYNKISILKKYIKTQNKENKNVIIIASDSALTMISLNKNNQEFDLVFNGNLGYNGENKLIEKIKSLKDTEFLIFTNEDDCFWQESPKIRNYIIENLNKTGEILDYSIYEIKEQ